MACEVPDKCCYFFLLSLGRCHPIQEFWLRHQLTFFFSVCSMSYYSVIKIFSLSFIFGSLNMICEECVCHHIRIHFSLCVSVWIISIDPTQLVYSFVEPNLWCLPHHDFYKNSQAFALDSFSEFQLLKFRSCLVFTFCMCHTSKSRGFLLGHSNIWVISESACGNSPASWSVLFICSAFSQASLVLVESQILGMFRGLDQ